MTEPAIQTVVEHGEASTLPDTSWMFRRILIFVVALSSLALTWWIVGRITDIGTLRMIARYSQGLVALCIFVYVAGASATDVVRLVSAVRTTRRETVTSAPPPATISAEGDVETGTPAAAPIIPKSIP